MKIPVPRPTKFIIETQEILNEFSKGVNSDDVKKVFSKIHKNNIFNKRFSGVLDAFSDLKSVTERIEENIEQSIKIERELQESKEINQELHGKADKLTAQNQTDLKTLYIYSKIFLDEYTNLLKFIFDWRGIGDKSVTSFYKSLKKYKGKDETILGFKECCQGKLQVVDVYITEYRDTKIVHNQQKHKQDTQWFLNNMNGEIRFIGGGRPSITPQEILFIVVEYVDDSTRYCLEWLNNT
jgi:hypothetical protein